MYNNLFEGRQNFFLTQFRIFHKIFTFKKLIFNFNHFYSIPSNNSNFRPISREDEWSKFYCITLCVVRCSTWSRFLYWQPAREWKNARTIVLVSCKRFETVQATASDIGYETILRSSLSFSVRVLRAHLYEYDSSHRDIIMIIADTPIRARLS